MGTPDPLLSRGLWVFVCVWPSTFNLLVLSIFFLNGDTTMIFCQLSIKTDTFHIKCVHSQFNFFFCSSLWIFQFLVNLLGLLARYHKTWDCLLLLEKSHFQWGKNIFFVLNLSQVEIHYFCQTLAWSEAIWALMFTKRGIQAIPPKGTPPSYHLPFQKG